MSEEIKRVDIKEFRETGYLQEVNRQFFHPLGLALEIKVNSDGTESLGGIWDYRGDPEGIRFGPGMVDAGKARRIAEEHTRKGFVRQERFGYIVQPLDGESLG